MHAGSLSRRFVAQMALAVAGAILMLSSHSALAQRITVSTPFPFSVDRQQYPAGTYQFALISESLLSIRNVHRGEEKVFLIRPEANGPLAAHGGLKFDISQGHRSLQAVFIPGTGMAAELFGNESGMNGWKGHSLPQKSSTWKDANGQ